MESFAGYRIVQELGRGGTAIVYLARKGEGPEVALKVLTRHGRTEQMSVRFRREIEAMRKLSHPRILRLLDAGCEGEDLWYAMEYSEKRSLQDVLDDRLAGGGILAVEEVLRLATGLGEALAYLHARRIVHRDLKPENILVDDRLEPTLMDFGLAKDFERSEMTAEGMIMGTPRYMAPEQVQGTSANTSADVYQVGLILYRALTGKLPLEDDNPFATAMRRMQEAIPPPSTARPNVPPGLDRILLQCLRSRPEERYPHMGAFLEQLRDLDSMTGELLAGRAMPGKVAESTQVTSRAAFQAQAKETTIMTTERPAGLMPRGSGPTPERITEPSPGSGRLVPVLVAGVALVLALVALLRPGAGSAPSVGVEQLTFDRVGEELQVFFRTDRAVSATLELDPAAAGPYVLSERPRRLHSASLSGIDRERERRYRLRLTGEDGAWQVTDWQLLHAEAAGEERGHVSSLVEERFDGGAEISFRTARPATAWVHYGRREPLVQRVRAHLTGTLVHSVTLRGLDDDEEYRYQVVVRTRDGQEARSGVQLLAP